jgi:hypothetical protein
MPSRNAFAACSAGCRSHVDRVGLPLASIAPRSTLRANEQLALTRAISPAQHAVLDYGVAATFFTLGMKYRNRNAGAAALAFINGAMVLGMSMLTDYPGGFWRKTGFRTQGKLAPAQAALAGFGPALFGFADEPEANSFRMQALSQVGVVAMTAWNGAATPF